MNVVTKVVFIGVLLSAGWSTRVCRNYRIYHSVVSALKVGGWGGGIGGRKEGRALLAFGADMDHQMNHWTLFSSSLIPI